MVAAVKKALSFTAIFAALFVCGCIISVFSGKDALRACGLAMAVSVAAAAGGFAPVLYTGFFKSDHMAIGAMAGGLIRILLAVAGFIIVIKFVPVSVVWFLAWLGLFYLATVIVETFFVVSRMKVRSE